MVNLDCLPEEKLVSPVTLSPADTVPREIPHNWVPKTLTVTEVPCEMFWGPYPVTAGADMGLTVTAADVFVNGDEPFHRFQIPVNT